MGIHGYAWNHSLVESAISLGIEIKLCSTVIMNGLVFFFLSLILYRVSTFY